MIVTLIRRELLDNLMTFRFAAAVFIMLLLVVTNTVVLIKDYERRLAGYNDAVKMHQRQLQETNTYSAGEMYVDRPPNPLSIFNVGFDAQLENKIEEIIDDENKAIFYRCAYSLINRRSLSTEQPCRRLHPMATA